MVEDNMEEETYSLIFTSLKHPIRRRILRMLADKPLTYSEILETRIRLKTMLFCKPFCKYFVKVTHYLMLKTQITPK